MYGVVAIRIFKLENMLFYNPNQIFKNIYTFYYIF